MGNTDIPSGVSHINMTGIDGSLGDIDYTYKTPIEPIFMDGPTLCSSYSIKWGYFVKYDSDYIFIKHRLDGPALISHTGSCHWYINNLFVTTKITQWAEYHNIDLDDLSDVDKALIKIEWASYGR